MNDITARFFARRRFGMKPGLEAERDLLSRLENPERGMAAIHVAGTNGKGSTCAMLDAILTAAGFRTGRYTSPHLVRFNERYRFGGRAIDDEGLHELMVRVEEAAVAREAEGHPAPTFFECATAMAFEGFRQRDVQLAILETGMGGRLDATNVVIPLVSVITRIGLDHTQWLGDTLEAVAGEKAGIIKPGRPVVMAAMPEEAADVIRGAAAAAGSPLIAVEDAVSVVRVSGDLYGQKVRIASPGVDYGTVRLSLAGAYQLENAATAVATAECLGEVLGLPMSADAVVRGLGAVPWSGRFQVVADDPVVLVDGAHNRDGARALVQALKQAKAPRRVALVAGLCNDKDADGFFAAWGGTRPVCWAAPLLSPRGLEPLRVAEAARRHAIRAHSAASLREALDAARAWASREDGMVVVAGSLFLAGEVLELLEIDV